jgi:predicted alpha/beta-hydrolase family hydrolase
MVAATAAPRTLSLEVDDRVGRVSALWWRPRAPVAVLVLAHGAGADMHHAFMEGIAERLAARRVASLRFQFPYAEAGRRSPNPRPVLLATVAAAVERARTEAPDATLLAGGKSMGGRMTSLLAAERALPVDGLVFYGFPLHAAGRPSRERGEHLAGVGLPMLFLQGTRDRLADLSLLEPLVRALRPRPVLHRVEDADHGFHVRRRSGRSDDEVLDELADATREFAQALRPGGRKRTQPPSR